MTTYDEIKKNLLHYVTNSEVLASITNAADFIKYAMEYMEDHSLPGDSKAEILSLIIQDVVSSYIMNKRSNVEILIPLPVMTGLKKLAEADLIVPTMTLISDASKGKLQINKPFKCVPSFSCCK